MDNDITDEELIPIITSGDNDVFRFIIERYETKLHRYIIYLIHDQTIANDVVQETFIKAYQNLRSFNSRYKFSSWIYRIAHNEAMNAIKRNRKLTHVDIDTLPDTEYNAQLGEIIDAKLLKRHVQECLQEIDPKYREVVHLIYFEKMKYDEVSDILHIPASTVGVWLSRAKAKLKHICEQKGVSR